MLNKAKQQVQTMREQSLKQELLKGELLMVVFEGISLIEEIILQSLIFLDTSILAELPDDENILYNENCYRENLISELEFDMKKIRGKAKSPLLIKKGKCNFCYPNNKAYNFHNPKTDELIFTSVVDKVDDEQYIAMVCENKSRPKLSKKSIENDIPF